MNEEMNINLNNCLVERTDVGSYKYINICTGETTKIDWDLIGWTYFSLIGMLIILIIVIACILIKEFIGK
nr:MAG TPA: hypothetical protein [Bacteriophage sp.]